MPQEDARDGGAEPFPVESDPPEDDSGPPRQLPDFSICKGQPGIELYVMFGSSGTVFPGSEFVSQNGAYRLFDGSCRAYCYGLDGRAFARDLDEASREAIEAALETGDLSSLAGTHASALCDGPYAILSFEDYQVRVVSVCPGGADGPDLPAAQDLLGSVGAAFDGCGSELWTRVNGDVKYNLVRTEPDAYPNSELTNFRNAPAWPLGDPELVARGEDEPALFDPAEALVASGEDAAALRQILDDYLAGRIGVEWNTFIPIEQPDGVRYLLYVRDTIPLEGADGSIGFE